MILCFSGLCFLFVLSGDSAGLDSKYFEKRDDCISIYGLSSNPRQRGKSAHLLKISIYHILISVRQVFHFMA